MKNRQEPAGFHREALCEVRDAGLGHAINGFGGESGESSLRAHIDDPTTRLADHHTPRGLASKECPLEIYRQREVEIRFGHIFSPVARSHACVIYQDIKATEIANYVVYRVSNLVEARHAHLER